MDALARIQRREAKGRLIRKLRESKGYSQQLTAASIGVARSTIQKVENGETGTEDAKFWEFLELVGVSEAEFAHMLENEIAREKIGSVSEEEERIDAELIMILKYQSMHVKRILHFIFCGGFKGNIDRLFDLIAIHITLPLRRRLQHSISYQTEYSICRTLGEIISVCPEEPDIAALQKVNEEDALTAAVEGKEGY